MVHTVEGEIFYGDGSIYSREKLIEAKIFV